MKYFKLALTTGPKAKALLWLLLFFVGVQLLFRGLFFVVFSPEDLALLSVESLQAFKLGTQFDLRVALYALLPFAFLNTIPLLSWTQGPRPRKLWTLYLTVAWFLLLGVHFVDMGYYGYLESRLSVSISQFFLNPLISAQMLWESYNVIVIMLGYFVLGGAGYWVFKQILVAPPQAPQLHLGLRIGKGFIYFVLYVVGIHGSLSQYPLRWSEAFFSTNQFVSSLALNPAHYLWDTASNHNTSYDLDQLSKHHDAITEYLGLSGKPKDFKRQIRPMPKFPKDTNVVYIVMESYAAYKMHAMGNVLGSSPVMDALAERGWFFRNFYTPTEGTARSMFCSLTGIPDINADSTSSRNPMVVEQNTLINAYIDHTKYYFIGGSANWGNIRGIYKNNINGLKMYEEDNFDRPKTDVWGLNDLDLFRETAKVLKNHKGPKPFFAMIQAASFHRPYTIPEDRGDFQKKELSDEERKRFGWRSNEEFNSFRFSDYALGEFFRLIAKSDFYKDTLFIIHGDHGLPHNDAEHLTEGYKQFALSRFHVPLVFYMHDMEPKVFDQMASQVDVLTTVTSLLGIEAPHSSLGRNILSTPKDKQFAFSYVYYDRPVTKMLFNQEYLAITDKSGEVKGLYRYNEDPSTDVRAEKPDLFQNMSGFLHGIYESARFLIQNNRRMSYQAGRSPN